MVHATSFSLLASCLQRIVIFPRWRCAVFVVLDQKKPGNLGDVFPPKSEMISKSSDVSEIISDIFQKISHVFWKKSNVFWKNSDVFFERSAENSLRSLVSRKFSASSSVKHGGLLVCFLGNR